LKNNARITVFYDRSCPSCVKDRALFESIAGKQAVLFDWFDITDQDEALKREGIEPLDALRELHIKDTDGKIYSAMDAYSLMMRQVPCLKPLGFIVCWPMIKPLLSYWYRRWVDKRLTCEGRL